jgi:hypothetical protein
VFELRRRDCLALLGGTAAGISQAFAVETNEIPTIGFLSARARDESSDLTAAFIRGLENRVYVRFALPEAALAPVSDFCANFGSTRQTCRDCTGHPTTK